MPLSLDSLLREFGAIDENDLLRKRTAGTEKLVKAMTFSEMPRRVELTADQCKKLCEKSGLRYQTGYEGRVIERVTTTEAADRYGDIVRAKGIDNMNYRKNAVVLFSHNHGDFPVGKSIKEWIDKGINGWRSWDLYFDDVIDPTGKSDLTFRMVDSGAMPAGSIGFIPGNSKADHNPEERLKMGLGKYGVEYLTCEKLEHSACSVPANPEALSNCLKSIEAKRFKAMFGKSDVDRMVAEKMLGAELAQVFSDVLGVKRNVSIPKAFKERQGANILRAFPSEHEARVKDPADFIDDSFARENTTDGVDVISGKLIDGDETMVAQSYRFDAAIFSAYEAEKWLAENEIEYIDFKPAEDKSVKALQTNNNVIVNVDLGDIIKSVIDLKDEIKTVQASLDSITKSFEDKTSDFLAATQRALNALEQKTKLSSLYDRKEIENVLRVQK